MRSGGPRAYTKPRPGPQSPVLGPLPPGMALSNGWASCPRHTLLQPSRGPRPWPACADCDYVHKCQWGFAVGGENCTMMGSPAAPGAPPTLLHLKWPRKGQVSARSQPYSLGHMTICQPIIVHDGHAPCSDWPALIWAHSCSPGAGSAAQDPTGWEWGIGTLQR